MERSETKKKRKRETWKDLSFAKKAQQVAKKEQVTLVVYSIYSSKIE